MTLEWYGGCCWLRISAFSRNWCLSWARCSQHAPPNETQEGTGPGDEDSGAKLIPTGKADWPVRMLQTSTFSQKRTLLTLNWREWKGCRKLGRCRSCTSRRPRWRTELWQEKILVIHRGGEGQVNQLKGVSPPTSMMMPPAMAMRLFLTLSSPPQVVHFIPMQATPRPATETTMLNTMRARVAWRAPEGRGNWGIDHHNVTQSAHAGIFKSNVGRKLGKRLLWGRKAWKGGWGGGVGCALVRLSKSTKTGLTRFQVTMFQEDTPCTCSWETTYSSINPHLWI